MNDVQTPYASDSAEFLLLRVSDIAQKIHQEKLGSAKASELAKKGSRQAYWVNLRGFKDTPVFAFEALRPGNSFSGPALIEAVDTTFVIEPGWHFTLDHYYTGVLERI